MTEVLVILCATVTAVLTFGHSRGHRIPGPSWFEIPHPSGRAERRKRR